VYVLKILHMLLIAAGTIYINYNIYYDRIDSLVARSYIVPHLGSLLSSANSNVSKMHSPQFNNDADKFCAVFK